MSLDDEDSEYHEGDEEEEQEDESEPQGVEGWDDDENILVSRPKGRPIQLSGDEDENQVDADEL
jgi:hypothetical protein